MRIILIIISLLIALPQTFAQEKKTKDSKKFNYGVSLSANAPFVHDRKTLVNNIVVSKPSNETKMAGSISLFGRVNLKNHYLQLEAGTSVIRDVVTLDIKEFGYSSNLNIDSKNFALTLDIPLIYGYNFIKRDKYELSLFVGPKLRYTYLNKEDINNPQNITFNLNEDTNPITACVIIGMGTKISRVLIDFKYEFGITEHNKPGTFSLYENSVLISEGTFYAKRSINLLSFSLGVIL
ncbi:MAG: PorT family protein [Bacteroidales bacterium]|nr:PorT family protein [Bacteroidales bacterium]